MIPARVPLVAAIVFSVVASTRLTAQIPPQPLTLDAALEYAAAHYPAVRASVELVAASTADADAVRSTSRPRLDALWQINRATVNNVTGLLLPQSVVPSISGPPFPATSGQSVWGSALGALFSWEPFDLGLRDATVREAEAAVVRARAGEVLTRLEVQQAVGTSFLALVGAGQAAAAADADVTRRSVLARTARTLADNQLRPGAEASRAEAELSGARTRAIQAWQAVATAQSMLMRVLGATDPPVVETARVLEAVPAAPVPDAPVERHPLAVARQAAIEVSRARDDALSTTTRPRLFVQSSLFARGTGANGDGTLEGGADGLGLERTNWAVGLQVVFPNLFEVATVRAKRTSAEATTRAETARYDEGLLAIAHDRRVAAAAVDAARAIVLNTPEQLASARLSETQARARYDAGLASIVEVADAQNLLAVAEYQDAAARVDVWRALLAQAVAAGDLDPFISLAKQTKAP